MRIESIHINSFGKLRERDFRLVPGLNVFYGPNESGKSTAMEFIRSTLVPMRGRSYPERTKTDSGTIVYEEDGTEKRIQMEGKTGHAGDVPRCMAEMDPAMYRNIFAMTREGLDEMSPLSNGDIRTRFLTIPGGESIPVVIEGIDKDRDCLIGKTSSSPSRINDIKERESSLQARIAKLRSNAESYSELSARKGELEDRLDSIRESNRSAEENNAAFTKVESQRAAFNNLGDYRRQKLELAGKTMAQKEAEETYLRLSDEKKQADAAFNAVDDSRRRQISSLPGGDEARLLEYRPRIQSLLDRQPEYQSRLSNPLPQPVKKDNRSIRMIIAAMLVVIAAAVWIVPDIDVIVKVCIDVLAVGAAAAVMLIRGKELPVAAERDHWLDSYEAEVQSVVEAIGMVHTNPASDLRRLSDILNTLNTLDATRAGWTDLKMAAMAADNRLLGFLSQYGGEKGYIQARKNYDDYLSLEAKITALEGSIRQSGMDPDKPLPVLERMPIDRTEQDAINTEIGRLAAQMKGVLDTKELDALIDQAYLLNAEKEKVLKDGAVALLSSAIVQNACADLYESVHPDVISTADRYLSMMTMGTCHFDLDPRNSELSVISCSEPKNSKQWSTGLRAQILLSIKLAIAKEMGSGEIPVILDDVLLPFDSDRKRGACEALSMLSSEMQVMLYTCDDDVEEICRSLSNVSVIAM